MAGDNLNVWYDPEGDHLEIVFDQKAGYFEDTSLENVMRKRDAEGHLLAISIFNVSSFSSTRPPGDSTSGHGSWAVFNLDVEDRLGFEFDVALGYEWLGEGLEETEPESTSIAYASADACASCSVVFFHATRSGLRLVERTLEVIHKPLSSPVGSIGSDPLSPVSLTSLCRDQLALALRLFQPQSFLMFPRAKRDEGRGRAYVALAHQAGAPVPYVLQGPHVARFLEFARKLRAFHVDRNRYRGRRWDPRGFVLFPGDQAEAEFFKRVARLMIATDLFEQANEIHAFSSEMRLLWLVMAAEALFTHDEKKETSSQLVTRMARLNGAGEGDVKRHEELVRSMYEARNKLMHGKAYVGMSKQPAGLVGDAGFIEPTPKRLLEFDNLVRASILYFIALQDVERREVLEILDRSVLDPLEVAKLRKKANEYWGLTDREDEMLCSTRWVA